MTDIPVLVGSVAAATLLASGRIASALKKKGVPIPVHVTGAQSAARAALPTVAGVAYTSDYPASFTQRWADIQRGLSALRGFRVVMGLTGAKSYTQMTAADYRETIEAFTAAVRAGVKEGGYRVTASSVFGVSVNGEAALDQILTRDEPPQQTLMGVNLRGLSPFGFTLSPLGEAVRAAELERRRVAHAVAQDHVRTHAIIFNLALEMDESGYLITGRPPPDPRIADAIAYAADTTVKTVAKSAAKVGGDLGCSIVSAALRSSVFWAAGLAFIGWKVLR